MQTLDHHLGASNNAPHPVAFPTDPHFRQKVVPFLQSNLDDPHFQMQDLCAYLHMSRTRLHRKLKRHCGMHFTQLLTALRMHQAKTLLLTSDLTVSQITYKVGFKDPSYFVRIFRKLEGVTPRRFRLEYLDHARSNPNATAKAPYVSAKLLEEIHGSKFKM